MPENRSGRIMHWTTEYGIAGRTLEVLVIVLLSVTAVIPGVLHVLYRADAQVALGNARLVRTALETTALEAYGDDRPLSDPASGSGITEEAYRNVLLLSKAPGDFWVTQVDESGYHVLGFFYREGDYFVICRADPVSYEVLRAETYAGGEGVSAGTGGKQARGGAGTE